MGDKNDYMEKCWRRYRPMIYLAGFSGMRPPEIRGLAWPQITETAVHVKQRADQTGIIGPVKSKAGKRTICNCSASGYVELASGAPARVRRIASRAPMERRRAVSMTERMSA